MKTSIKLSILISILILLNSKHIKSQCHIDDWYALRQLYLSTDGDNWTHNTGWQEVNNDFPSPNCNLDNLRGVYLNEQGRVDSLFLSANQLNGSIPSELGNLTGLIELRLNGNQLTGTIPAEIGNLIQLQDLRLHQNHLTGEIPTIIGNLNNLVQIQLHTNQLSGNIPIELGSLANLKVLNLAVNQLNGSIPVELGNLTNLEILLLHNNQLSGNIPVELGDLTNLTILNLVVNELSGSIPSELSNLNSLEVLILHTNQLSGNIPVELSNLTNLMVLNLALNQLSGGIPVELGNLTSLTGLYLHRNLLSEPIPKELGNLTSLTELYLHRNQLSELIPAELGNLTNLIQLQLHTNQLSGSIPAELSGLTNLSILNLAINQLSGAIPTELGNLTNLEILNLHTNQLSNSIPVELGNLTNLSTLNLNMNQLSSSIPKDLGNLINLTNLNISDNLLSDIIPSELGNLTNLTLLRLYNNNLSGCYPTNLSAFCTQLNNPSFDGNPDISNGNNFDTTWEDFCETGAGACLPNCYSNDWAALKALYESTDGDNWITNTGWQEVTGNTLSANCNLELLYGIDLNNQGRVRAINLVDNQLNGSIPAELGSLSNLNDLWLSDNQLSGRIPSELADLNNLLHLSLSENELSGNIPLGLAGLNLQVISLNDNQLSGSIPPGLGGSLQILQFLNISNNNLSGCYSGNLLALCTAPFFTTSNAVISNGNNFDAPWEDFCANGDGVCVPSDVYPGDLNHDGIVNNQDVGLWGLFLYEIGPPRASEYQNTNWYAHPAEDWNRQQINNEDIKHFDTNGNGAIEDTDCQAVTANFGQTWSTPLPPPSPPQQSDLQVMLQPINQVIDGYLIYNISLERRAGGDLNINGGYFTIDYSFIEGNINFVELGIYNDSWLGNRGVDIFYVENEFLQDKKIEVGFTKINNLTSTGSGIIGDLIVSYDNTTSRSANNSTIPEIRVTTIGMHNGDEFTLIENEISKVSFGSDYCEPNWTITENTPFQNDYQSSGTIETNGFLIISEDQEVNYKADRITLNSGFSVKAGANFEVRVDGCSE